MLSKCLANVCVLAGMFTGVARSLRDSWTSLFCGAFGQLVASTDHLRTWVDLYSLVDHFTIVPTFVSIYYDSNWIGLYILLFLGDPAFWILLSNGEYADGTDRQTDRRTDGRHAVTLRFPLDAASVMKMSLKIPPHLKHVITLPCEILDILLIDNS